LNLIRVMPAKGQDIMQTSVFLAKLIGPISVVIGFGLLLNAHIFRRLSEQFVASDALVYFSGLLAMAAGMAIVLTHNVWQPLDWPVLITLLGWLMVIGGAIRIAVPQFTEAIGRWMLRKPALWLTLSALFYLAYGGLLCLYGYTA
jgi:hypothetical protein